MELDRIPCGIKFIYEFTYRLRNCIPDQTELYILLVLLMFSTQRLYLFLIYSSVERFFAGDRNRVHCLPNGKLALSINSWYYVSYIYF